MKEHEHQTFFDGRAEQWDENGSVEKTEKIRKVFTDYNISPQGNILDVGAGTGVLIPVLREFSKSNSMIYELDFSREMILKDKIRWKKNDSSIFHVQADTQYLPFPDNRFNFLACFAVLPHLSDQKKAMDEWLRVLDNEGVLMILHLMSSKQLNRFHSTAGQPIRNDILKPVNRVSKVLINTGFSVVSMEEKEGYVSAAGGKEVINVEYRIIDNR